MSKNKIIYGLSNCHVWPITSTDDSGKPTYGDIINMPGATEMSLDAEGSSDPFYADDNIYYQGVANNGYSGSITLADIPDDFRTKVLGEIVDKNGVIFEDSNVQPKEFAIAFEFKGDAAKRRHLFYRCTATRPSIASSTKEDSIKPNPSELPFTAAPRLDTGYPKASVEEGEAGYADWYGKSPYEYTEASSET